MGSVVDGHREVGRRHRVRLDSPARLTGDFPGGEGDLVFDFTISDGLITALRIAE